MQAPYFLSQRAHHQGYHVEAHERVTSTNMLALNHARQAGEGLLWVVGGEQTQGVGRRGRSWHSPPGNLYASLLLVADYPSNKAALLGFVAGVSLAETLTRLTGTTGKIHLKWPNDVLLDGAKLTGILVERHPLPQKTGSQEISLEGKAAIIIGIGINVTSAPQSENYTTTCLHAKGFDLMPQQIFTLLSEAWSVNFDLWDGGRGFGAIREKWLSHAAGLGKDIHVVCQGRKVSGCFKTIDAQGQLVIEMKEGVLVTISAGDVHFGDAASWHPKKG